MGGGMAFMGSFYGYCGRTGKLLGFFASLRMTTIKVGLRMTVPCGS